MTICKQPAQGVQFQCEGLSSICSRLLRVQPAIVLFCLHHRHRRTLGHSGTPLIAYNAFALNVKQCVLVSNSQNPKRHLGRRRYHGIHSHILHALKAILAVAQKRRQGAAHDVCRLTSSLNVVCPGGLKLVFYITAISIGHTLISQPSIFSKYIPSYADPL